MGQVIYVVCPLCGLNRPLEKTGAGAIARGLPITEIKGRIHFDHIDLESAPIVQVRERQHGPEAQKRMTRGGGSGFVFRKGLTLTEMKDDPIYNDLVLQLKKTSKAILKILQ